MRIYLGGYPGAGKSTLGQYLKDQGWHRLGGFDQTPDLNWSDVHYLLDQPADHPEFNHPRVFGEGGFLDKAPKFQAMFQRVGFFPVWLTGSYENLRATRVARGDNPGHLRADWMALVDSHRHKVRWAMEVDMWQPDGERKTSSQVMEEIIAGMKE